MNGPLSPASPASAARQMWLVVVLLLPVAMLNYLDRQMMAAMKTSVQADIPPAALTASIPSEVTAKAVQDARAAEWGFMLAVFKWVYAALSPLGGYLADRFSRRLTICTSLLVWSAVTFATGQVTTYEQLLWTRALMGISEAFYIPAALALVADYHTGGTRSRAVGLHQMAIYVGIILGGFSGYAAESPHIGWRAAFSVAGLVGIVYSAPLFYFLTDAPRLGALGESSPTRPSPAAALASLLTNGSYLLLLAYFTLPAIAGWVVKDWMPDILKQKFNIGQGIAGVSATLYVNIAAIAGALLGGWTADRWMRRTRRGRIYTSAAGMSLFIPALFGVGNAGSLTEAIMFLVLFGIGWGYFDCNNMPILSQIVPKELRATGYGLMNLLSISCGGLADWGFGLLRDAGAPLNGIFAAFSSLALLSVITVLLIRPRPELEVQTGR